ncbi:TPA: hypothetical protein ACGASL_005467, partial [Escherichia coli]
RGFHASDRSDSPKPRQRVRRRLAGAPAAGPDAARQPGAEGAPGRQDNTAVVRIRAAGKRRAVAVAVAVAVAGTTTSSVTDK